MNGPAWDDRGGGSMTGPGGDWHGLRPSFENPMSWSLPVGRYAGLTIRIHALFLLFAAVLMLRSIWPPGEGQTLSSFGPMLTGAGVACLLVIALTHELGHVLFCRWTGGGADEILLWPFGGLAHCRPPNRWSAHLLTALGGPVVNVAFCLAAGTMLWLVHGMGRSVALPSPFDVYSTAYANELTGHWPLFLLFAVNWISLVMLLLNLLPVFPLDGGRILHALLWSRMGYAPAMRVTVRAGYGGAIAMGIVGAVLGSWILLAVAIFGGVTCWLTHRQTEFTEAALYGAAEEEQPDEPNPGARDRAERSANAARREAEEAREVDRILARIAEHGMDSLSAKERRLLKRVTKRKQKSERR